MKVKRKTQKIDPRIPQWRFLTVVGFIVLGFIGLIARTAWIQVIDPDRLRQEGDLRSLRTTADEKGRGMITDRNGEPLAWTLRRGKDTWTGLPPGAATANSPELLIRLAIAGADKDAFARVPAEGAVTVTYYRNAIVSSFLELPVIDPTAPPKVVGPLEDDEPAVPEPVVPPAAKAKGKKGEPIDEEE